jgi:tyrosyl-tRNA synthetase
MNLSEELAWRGFTNQTTLKNVGELDDGSVSFYWGVDPSSDSMTIGNLAAAMMVRCFMEAGHRAFLLVGGATGMIGDPDGKSDERNQKAEAEIARNKAAIADQYSRIFAGRDFTVVDNYDWFKDINYIDFLRDIGKNAPLSQMLGRDFVQARLGADGNGISYAEFSYSLMQAYDFLHLFRTESVTLQLCGADQWGNSVAGVDLVRRVEGKEVHVYSTPLVINKITGAKFGKTEDGAIWLDSSKTSVYAFYQFWLNVDDDSVIDYLKIFTLLSREEIEQLEVKLQSNPSERTTQRTLAHEVTSLVHGPERTISVERVTKVLFGENTFDTLSDEDIKVLAVEIPAVRIGTSVVDALVSSSVASSNGEARRLIESGAISINCEKITSDQLIDKGCLVKKGKNSFVLVR